MAVAPAGSRDHVPQGQSDRNRHVFHKVMTQVAVGCYGEIQATVPGQRGENMVEHSVAAADVRGRGHWAN